MTEIKIKDAVTSECKADYLEYKLCASKGNVKAMTIYLGIFNLLLLIPDKAMMAGATGFAYVLIARIAFSLILMAVYFLLEKIDTFKVLSLVVSLSEILSFLIFIFVFLKYKEPNLLIQTLGMFIIIIVVFLVPNQWLNMMAVSIIGACGFLVCAYFFVDAVDSVEYWASVVYIIVEIVLCAQTAYLTERFQFREFMAKREFERISSTDHLTKTANRYKMGEEANKWIDFCQRNSLPLTLVFIDIDDFKIVNDLYGHAVGDSVLAGLTDLIRGQLRTSDVISRWGGDEFILLFPNTPLDVAVSIMERIRNLISERAFIMEVKITCCYGIVEMKEDSDLKSMIDEADSLMYAGKKLEKNDLRYAPCDR
ncbi:MAG: diguanylate cyclase [Clostridia bacterium]|nr:diguanylate cyclase [Clostridia bacterium]